MIYVHIPLCRSFCTYCDFYSEIATDGCQERFVEALCAEIRARRQDISDELPTLYFGGGTPSVLPLSLFRRIFDTLAACGHGGPWAECTVEVNPEDIVEKGPAYVEGLLALGVDRISMGVQSFDDAILRWMHRRHDAAGALEAVRILREAGLRNLSLDLIFGLPQLDEARWMASVEKALECAPEHLSAYQLSLEAGSELYAQWEAGRFTEAPEEACRRQYEQLCERMAAAGYRHYEISNFALPGREAVHNGGYWARVPYAGFGPGAHSFDGKRRRWNSLSLIDWQAESETLSAEEAREERLMLSLRTDRGMDAAELHESCREETLADLLSRGMLVEQDGRIRISEAHWFVSDGILRALI